MTKRELLKIIEQNKDILTPENYEGIMKNADIFSDEEKEGIVGYLNMAKEMLAVNEKFMKAQNALYEKANRDMEKMDKEIQSDIKKASKSEEVETSKKADDLLSNL